MVSSEVLQEVRRNLVGKPLLIADPLEQLGLERFDPRGDFFAVK
jgi:hypothetical protein